MKFFKFTGLSTLALISVSAPLCAGAQTAETIADFRCVVIGTRLAESADPTLRQAGAMLVLYHLGRVEGREPTLDFESLLVKQWQAMTAADFDAELRRCKSALAAKGKQVTQIGKDIASTDQR
jgi:hypothetical protein